MAKKQDEKLLMDIKKAFGFTKEDFKDGKPIYTKWGTGETSYDIEDLADHSLKISKDLGDIYIERIRTDEYILVGEGTTLHCNDMKAGKDIVLDFKGFLM